MLGEEHRAGAAGQGDVGAAVWGSGGSQEGPQATAVHATTLEPHKVYNKVNEPSLLIAQVFIEHLLCAQPCGRCMGVQN